jgi:hypothetical protein
MELEITICTVDNLPYEISPAFQTMVAEIGLQLAATWTEKIDVPLGKVEDG